MLQKLHLQLTIFCTAITGAILLFLTVVCLIFARKNLIQNNTGAHLTEISSAVSYLQDQNIISYQWLSRLQNSGRFRIFLYDGPHPLYWQQSHLSAREQALSAEVAKAAKQHNVDLFTISGQKLTSHEEFSYRTQDREDYYVSAGIIPKSSGQLGFLILFPQAPLQRQLLRLRLMVLLGDSGALALLAVFFWRITGQMIVPLAEAQKKQTRFIASASHELRAPLAVIRSGLESLGKTEDTSQQQHFIGLLSDEGRRMQKLIDDMLLLANSDSGSLPVRPRPCQPDGLLLAAYEKYEPLAARKKIRLSLSLPEELLPDCLCDPLRMEQVFSILLDNALSYTPVGGSVELSLYLEDKTFCFCIADSGCGVPDSEKEQIFERFYRADQARSDREHFGLGLCIAREILKKHGGTIRVTDRPGQGSRFIAKLPVKNTSQI